MHPILFAIGPITVYSYGAMLAIALVLFMWLSKKVVNNWPAEYAAVDPRYIIDGSSVVLLGGLLFARLFYVFLHWDFFARSSKDILAVWQGGLVWYGGLLGGALAAGLYVRARKLPILRTFDQMVPFLALAHAIGRIGCFLNGCCYGRFTDSRFGVIFPGSDGAVIPTQLIEAGGLLFLYVVLRLMQRPAVLRRVGTMFICYLMLYSLLRFGVEFLRGDQAIWYSGLTLQQLISAVIFLIGLILLVGIAKARR